MNFSDTGFMLEMDCPLSPGDAIKVHRPGLRGNAHAR